MINIFKIIFGKIPQEQEEVKIVPKDFNIDEFNDWFKNDFDGYDGRKGAAGIFLRTDKFSHDWVKQYLKYIGQDTSFDNVYKHYEIIRKDWRNR